MSDLRSLLRANVDLILRWGEMEQIADGIAAGDPDDYAAHDTGRTASALLDAVVAALASPAVPDGLDEAWKAAEAALPEGWVLESDRWPDGECRAKAWQYAKPWAKAIEARGPTPAAALRALAARLTPQEPESRPEEGR